MLIILLLKSRQLNKINDNKRKINFKTINYSNLNNTIKINSKNIVDFHKENIIMGYNKK